MNMKASIDPYTTVEVLVGQLLQLPKGAAVEYDSDEDNLVVEWTVAATTWPTMPNEDDLR